VGSNHRRAVGTEWTEISHKKIAELDDVGLIMLGFETNSDQQAALDQR
jgi:hypothetical protein